MFTFRSDSVAVFQQGIQGNCSDITERLHSLI